MNKPSPFHHLDKFHVINTMTGEAVEGHFSPGEAYHATQVLNDHNERYGHEARFEVKPL